MGGDGHLGICEQTRLNHQSGCKNKKGKIKVKQVHLLGFIDSSSV